MYVYIFYQVSVLDNTRDQHCLAMLTVNYRCFPALHLICFYVFLNGSQLYEYTHFFTALLKYLKNIECYF